ncbi:MAG: hypothetical protein E6Z87_00045 [Finegoldia magna]|nr:hypothetical protein [Finegoldia magna]
MTLILISLLVISIIKNILSAISTKAIIYYIGCELGEDKMPNKNQIKKATDEVIKHTINDLLKRGEEK